MNDDGNSLHPIDRARELTTVRQPLPNIFNPLFRNQGGVNRALIDALQSLSDKQSALELYSESIEARLNDQVRDGEKGKAELKELREFSKSYIGTLRGSIAELSQSRDAILASIQSIQATLELEKSNTGKSLDNIEQRLNAASSKFEHALEALEQTISPLSDEVVELKESKLQLSEALREIEKSQETSDERSIAIEESLNSIKRRTESLEESSRILDTEIREWQSRTEARSAEQETAINDGLEKLEQTLHADKLNLEKSIGQLKDSQNEETENLKQSIARARSTNAFARRPGDNSNLPTTEATISEEEFDDFYRRFEDQFRGNRESVFEKQSRHLDLVKDAVNDLKRRPKLDVLDLGCGRGEWLELVGCAHLKNRGVDQNTTFVQQCLDRDLDVVEADAIEYLSELPKNSCGAVTAFHVIEHLSFAELWVFFKQVIRVLAPGGIGIFETPNPNNLRVASHFFLTDITHVRPVPPSLASFLATYHGAKTAEIQQYHPFPEAEKYNELPMEISDAIYGPQDYSVVFYK